MVEKLWNVVEQRHEGDGEDVGEGGPAVRHLAAEMVGIRSDVGQMFTFQKGWQTVQYLSTAMARVK